MTTEELNVRFDSSALVAARASLQAAADVAPTRVANLRKEADRQQRVVEVTLRIWIVKIRNHDE